MARTVTFSVLAPALVSVFACAPARDRASTPPTVVVSSVTTTDSALRPLADSLTRTVERGLAADTTLRWSPANAALPPSDAARYDLSGTVERHATDSVAIRWLLVNAGTKTTQLESRAIVPAARAREDAEHLIRTITETLPRGR